MELEWLLLCHGMVTLEVALSLLCGPWPVFQGTIVERVHYFLTFGAYGYFLRFVRPVFGVGCTDAILSVEYYCCNRPNPILQIIYLVIMSIMYYLIAKFSFPYIPSYYLSGIHRYTSMVVVAVGVVLLLLTSFSDPGTIKAGNVSQYLSAYPYDNIIYSEKECPTSKIPKPARSKPCSICDQCMARFDHHCGWMWLLGSYNTQMLIIVFLSIVGMLLAGFLVTMQSSASATLSLMRPLNGKSTLAVGGN